MKFNAPSVATVLLALVAGVLTVFIHTSFGLPASWMLGLTLLLFFLAAYGISPLTGASFVAALHLPMWAVNLIAAALATLQIALQVIGGMSPALHGFLAGVVNLLVGLGFAPAVFPAVLPVARASR